jgi:thiamine-phosphate pyrophosphorylase
MNQQSDFGLYLILSNPKAGYISCAEAAVNQNVRFLQLRMKELDSKQAKQTAQKVRKITQGTSTQLIINDNLQLAIEIDADGIHLGQEDLSLTEAKTKWNVSGKIFGLSTHSKQQAELAEKQGADYIGVGPVHSTPTKPEAGEGLGIKETVQIIKSVKIPAVAIGGISLETLPPLLVGGIKNFCVIRAVSQALYPEREIKKLQKLWKMYAF